MLPTEDLSVYVYVLVDDAFRSGAIAIAPRPGPAPGWLWLWTSSAGPPAARLIPGRCGP